MKEMTLEEMQLVSGGTTYTCSTCGYECHNALTAGFHGGIYTWHFWNGGHWIVS